MATCYDCIFKISDMHETYCEEGERLISDGFGHGDCTTCDKFRQKKFKIPESIPLENIFDMEVD